MTTTETTRSDAPRADLTSSDVRAEPTPLADGGFTVLDNLVSLCRFHRRLVHEGGWKVALVDDAVVWADPDCVPATVEPLTASVDTLLDRHRTLDIGPRTIEASWHNDPVDLGFAVSLVAEHTRRARERAPATAQTDGSGC